jgi:hypothetical protein
MPVLSVAQVKENPDTVPDGECDFKFEYSERDGVTPARKIKIEKKRVNTKRRMIHAAPIRISCTRPLFSD